MAVGLIVGLLVGAAGLWWLIGSSQTPVERVLGLYLKVQADKLTAPGGSDTVQSFEVSDGEGFASVAARLQAAGLIKDAEAFGVLARVRGLDTGVEAGAHQLRQSMTAEQVLQDLQLGTGTSVRVTLPEGRRAEEVAEQLATAGLVDKAEFLTLVGAGVAAGSAVMDRPAGTGLEGYLFPDTYDFTPNSGAQAVLQRLLDNFEERLTPELRAQAAASGRSLYELVTLASIVERETGAAEERPKVARVYLNRLATPPYLLNADPTVQYGLGYQPDSQSWWKRPLNYDDLKSESAYNSYTNAGLPPGPIASPGLSALEAVLKPADGPWQYFVANEVACDGTHVFAETYDEHLANIQNYQTGGCGE
jgi:UPF0755 protein